jgi:MFS family permease
VQGKSGGAEYPNPYNPRMTIYLLVALAFCVHLGFAGSRLAVPLFAVDQGASPFLVGTLMALYAAFPAVLALPAGRIADRLGFQAPLLVGTIGVAAALLLPFFRPQIGTLYATAALIGIAFMALQLATQTLAGAIAKPSERARNFSLLSIGFAAANFSGPLLTGFLIDRIGYAYTFGTLALPLVPAIVIALFGSRWIPPASSRSEGARSGLFDLLRIKPLRDTLIASGIVSGAWDVYQFFMPIYGRAQELSATAIGIVMSAFGISIILVRLLLPLATRRFGEAQLLVAAMFVACFAFALFPMFSSALALALVSFLLGIGCGCGQPLSMTMVFNASPKGRVGEATGMRITVNQITHVLVPLLFGAVGSVAGYAVVFYSNAGFLAAGGYLSLRSLARR